MKLLLQILLNVFETSTFWGSKLDKNYKTSMNFYAHFQCYKLNTSIYRSDNFLKHQHFGVRNWTKITKLQWISILIFSVTS